MGDERYTYADIQVFAKFIQTKTEHKPTIGIICGTGLGGLAETLEESIKIPYSSIPKFPVSTVKGHNSQFVLGKLQGKTVICMQGRFHLYEGYPPWKIVAPVQVMKLLGVETLFVTNAAGGINRSYNVADLMIIKDHINFAGMAGQNPLVGPNMEEFGPRFPNMSDAYDAELRKLAHSISEELGYATFIREGVYAMISGPSFETPAELRFLQAGGVDAVGMSTCPEVTIARHCGMRCFGLTLVSNLAILGYDDCNGIPTHEEVLEAGKTREVCAQTLVSKMVERIN